MDSHKKILVIDDESVIVNTLGEILKREGYEIATALCGEDAIRCAQEFRPDFLLSDVAMPGVNGVDVVLRILEFLPDAHVLFISGHADSDKALDHARAEGFDFEIALKPVNPRVLLEKIADLFEVRATQRPVVLCVDGDAATRAAIMQFLKRAGFTLMEADTSQALERAKQHPDLILLDIGLPDMSGFAFYELLRQSPETARIPVVCLTNTCNDDEARRRALELGAKAFLTHPVDPDALCALLNTLAVQQVSKKAPA